VEIFFSASFSLPKEKLPYPALIFDGQLKTREAPGTAQEPYPIPVLANPKKIIQAPTGSGISKPSLPPMPSTPPLVPSCLSTSRPPSVPSTSLWKPGHLRSAYGAVCCHKFKPKNMTDDIFLAQILGHKLLPGAAALSVGQSYKDFYVVGD
jgi:Telomere resolvase